MDSLDLIREFKKLQDNFAVSKGLLEDFIEKAPDPNLMLAAITSYMKKLGKEDPDKMAKIKELVTELG